MNPSAPHLLLVEEDPTLGDITAFRLELLGFDVACVQTGEAALAAIASRMPNVLILDLYMEDMKGVDLINRLKNDQQTCEMPILALSSEADLDEVSVAFEAGADDYLVTPYDPAVLQDKLQNLINKTTVSV